MRHITVEAMTAGRKPVATAIKKLRNTDQRCRINPNEPKSEAMSLIPPDDLKDEEKRIWKTEAPGLVLAGILTNLDKQIFKRYCIKVAEYERFRRLVEEEGDTYYTPSGQWKPNPHVAMMDKAFDYSLKIGSLLGTDPSSRTRISVTKPQENDEWSFFDSKRMS